MSTATPQPAALAPAPQTRREILIVSHSSLFYWWPVWAVGFLMFAITIVSGDRMATIPVGSIEEHNAKQVTVINAKGESVKYENRDVLIAPEKTSLKATELHISRSKNLGVIFFVVLLLVIGITNVPLRGLWSVIVIVFSVSLIIILALLPGNVLEHLLEYLFILDVRINAAGYLMIALALFILWLLVFLFFDRQIYMVFTPGQLRVKLEIGDAETAYDTTGMTIQKQRSDLFRHWILGFGSGDLIVKTAGAHGHQFDMPNVLFLGRKVREIEDMLRSRQVVSGQNA
jgi:hypothetical protein